MDKSIFEKIAVFPKERKKEILDLFMGEKQYSTGQICETLGIDKYIVEGVILQRLLADGFFRPRGKTPN